ncbi:MAG: OmpH family outer membrane protein [Halanaerobium sp.]
MLNKNIFLAMVLSLSLIFLLSSPIAAIDAAVVEMETVTQEHPAAADVEADLQEEIMQVQEDFQEEAQDLDAEEDAEEMQQLQQEMQQEAQTIQQQLSDDLMEIVQPDLDSFREDKGYDLIFIDAAVVSGAENVTEEFIEYVNNK